MGAGSGLVRTILFVLNSAFTICGIAIIAAGVYVCVGASKYAIGGFSVNKNVGIGLIVVGCIIFVVAFFGCYGACKESMIFLILYIVCLAALCIAEIIILVVIKRSIAHAEDEIKREMEKSLVNYNKSPPDAKLWDELQKNYKCCGINGHQDWIKNKIKLPASCCTNESTDTKGIENVLCVPHGKPNLHMRGCHDQIWKTTKLYANLMFWLCIVALIVQISAIVLAILLTVSVGRGT